MFLMIFVNDASSLQGIPDWLGHAAAQEDRLGFSDTIFPAFLFIVGLSLPFAIRARKAKGDSLPALTGYVALRGAALLIMGFFHVNMDRYSHHALLPQPVWEILVTASFFVIWMDYAPGLSRPKKYALITTGICTLLLLAWLYRGRDGTAGMHTSWWGILGIIGWAYLACATIYLVSGGRLLLLLSAFLLLAAINILTHTGRMPFELWVIGDGSSATLVMAGIVISSLYIRLMQSGRKQWLESIMITAGIVMLVAGFAVRAYTGGISKIYGTPAWVFLCIGISLLMFACIRWLVETRGKQQWFTLISPAGSSTLTCYLLPYILYSIFWLTHFSYPDFFNKGLGGLVRSALVALVVIILAGLLEKRRIRLKI